jgi:ABC-type polysaccharide/polyol phosphate export permease
VTSQAHQLHSPAVDVQVHVWPTQQGIGELRGYGELFGNLLQRDLRSKYKRTVLGWGWSMINPLAQVVIFTFVFRFIFRAAPPPGANGVDSFPVWLLCGLLAWNYFTIASSAGMHSLMDNASLVQKSYFPRALLIAATTVAQIVTLLIEMVILGVILLIVGIMPFLWLPGVLVVLALLASFVTGFSLVLAVTNVYFRDTSHLMGLVFQVWFYATPVIYPYQSLVAHAARVPWLLWIYKANPMFQYVEGLRDLLYYQRLPGPGSMAVMAVAGLGMLVIGWTVFLRFEPRLAEEL